MIVESRRGLMDSQISSREEVEEIL